MTLRSHSAGWCKGTFDTMATGCRWYVSNDTSTTSHCTHELPATPGWNSLVVYESRTEFSILYVLVRYRPHIVVQGSLLSCLPSFLPGCLHLLLRPSLSNFKFRLNIRWMNHPTLSKGTAGNALKSCFVRSSVDCELIAAAILGCWQQSRQRAQLAAKENDDCPANTFKTLVE